MRQFSELPRYSAKDTKGYALEIFWKRVLLQDLGRGWLGASALRRSMLTPVSMTSTSCAASFRLNRETLNFLCLSEDKSDFASSRNWSEFWSTVKSCCHEILSGSTRNQSRAREGESRLTKECHRRHCRGGLWLQGLVRGLWQIYLPNTHERGRNRAATPV